MAAGVRVPALRGHVGRLVPGDRADVGCYVTAPGPLEIVGTGIACPYCETPMVTARQAGRPATFWRIVAVREAAGEFVGQEVPAGFVAVKCRPCDQVFTVPADRVDNGRQDGAGKG
jgi:hypothetical protein